MNKSAETKMIYPEVDGIYKLDADECSSTYRCSIEDDSVVINVWPTTSESEDTYSGSYVSYCRSSSSTKTRIVAGIITLYGHKSVESLVKALHASALSSGIIREKT